MALTTSQKTLFQKARSLGGGGQAVALSDEACMFIAAVVAADLGVLEKFPEVPKDVPPFFSAGELGALVLPAKNFIGVIDRLFQIPDADTFFLCLATLHKARLKYERILQRQPFPTIDQVGPRGLLQYGGMSARALAGFLLWRKWMYDIDNRAAQETGYLFEPIIAAAIGGIAVSAKKSPVRRVGDNNKGRQIDCLRDHHAYELKLRVTIAASGQGRWGEELQFPIDCQASGYVPVLVVFDPTRNAKLDELRGAFLAHGGQVHIGREAWLHLEEQAGPTMALFLERYVRSPIAELLTELPDEMPELLLTMDDNKLTIDVDGEMFSIRRTPAAAIDVEELEDDIPDDADEQI